MSGSTAEACRPSGYFLSWSFAQARFSGVKAKSSGCSGARRRTLIGSLLLLVSGSGARARRRLLAEHGTGGDVGQALLHIGLERVIANRDRRFFLQGEKNGVGGDLADLAGHRLGGNEHRGPDQKAFGENVLQLHRRLNPACGGRRFLSLRVRRGRFIGLLLRFVGILRLGGFRGSLRRRSVLVGCNGSEREGENQ